MFHLLFQPHNLSSTANKANTEIDPRSGADRLRHAAFKFHISDDPLQDRIQLNLEEKSSSVFTSSSQFVLVHQGALHTTDSSPTPFVVVVSHVIVLPFLQPKDAVDHHRTRVISVMKFFSLGSEKMAVFACVTFSSTMVNILRNVYHFQYTYRSSNPAAPLVG